MFRTLLEAAPGSVPPADKRQMMLEGLNTLGRHHYDSCAAYARIIDGGWGGLTHADRLEALPFLPVSLFKELDLSSVEKHALILQSSGTTGQRPSRIFVDNDTAARQAEALVATFRPILGERRLPFLAIDTRQVIVGAQALTARGAGVLGMMKFGAQPTFALSPVLDVDRDAVAAFVAKHGGQKFLIFGFTFLVWSKLHGAFADGEIDLSNAVLIHSGGWKKLEAEKVSNEVFRASLARRFGITRIHNFYGFVEQIGSMFVEGADGWLHPPNFTDVIIRRPGSLEPAAPGEEGLIQVVSLLPTSYPGHSVLTEDLGVLNPDGSGGLRVLGRVPKAELRGCSDVVAAGMAA
jgi:hypothetical protein